MVSEVRHMTEPNMGTEEQYVTKSYLGKEEQHGTNPPEKKTFCSVCESSS